MMYDLFLILRVANFQSPDICIR